MDGGESDIRQTFLLLLLFYYFIKIFNKKILLIEIYL